MSFKIRSDKFSDVSASSLDFNLSEVITKTSQQITGPRGEQGSRGFFGFRGPTGPTGPTVEYDYSGYPSY